MLKLSRSVCTIAIVLLASVQSYAQTKEQRIASLPPFKLGVVDKISSKYLSETRTLNVYLPDEYYKDSVTCYPVIYLLDGSANEDFIHVTGVVQFLTMIRSMPPTIVVGIANVDRKRDFTFPTTIDSDLHSFPTTGHSEPFIQFLDKELQPYIQRAYRCNTSKTLIGQSLGGLLATQILLTKPSMFNRFLIVSPSIWWDNSSILAKANDLKSKKAEPGTRVYIAVGSEGDRMENDARHLADLIKRAGNENIKFNFHYMPDENHLTILHNCVYQALISLNKDGDWEK